MWYAARQVKNKVELKCASFAGRPVGNSKKILQFFQPALALIYCKLESAILWGI